MFTYDKRGTGQSGGFYTQNFRVAGRRRGGRDAAGASAGYRALQQGGGYWGQSQGAVGMPLATTAPRADFVVVSFGLISSPIAEDRDQMLLEAERLSWAHVSGTGSRSSPAPRRCSCPRTCTGFEALGVHPPGHRPRSLGPQPQGEYSGDMLRMHKTVTCAASGAPSSTTWSSSGTTTPSGRLSS